ncbi:MAG: hypothetical protein Q9186_001021 [Xanthomendoza sp. 1 TL-2023]
MAGVDELTATTCQTPVIGWVCSFCCSSFPSVGESLFPTACTGDPIQNLSIEMESQWMVDAKANMIDNGPEKLSEYRANCSYFDTRIRRVRSGFGIPRADQDDLLEKHHRLCEVLNDIPSKYPRFTQYVAMFSESLLEHIDKTKRDIDKAADGSTGNALTEQQIIISRIPVTMSTWREKYADIEGPGFRFMEEVQDAGGLASDYMAKIEGIMAQTVQHRKAIIKKWPLARRLGRTIGLLRHDPEEMLEVNEAFKALEELHIHVRGARTTLMFVERNVTKLIQPLNDLSTKAFETDLQFYYGPNPLLQARMILDGLRSTAQEVVLPNSGRRVIEQGKPEQGEGVWGWR